MRVVSLDQNKTARTGNRGAKRSEKSGETGGAASATRSPFMQILEEVLSPDAADTGDLRELWSQLPDAERELLEHQSDANLRAYREIVRAIAAASLKKNMHVKKIRRKNRAGEMVELSIVQVVDERLQKMALMMQSPGNSAFQMLRAVEEIRGMLIDTRDYEMS